MSRLSFLLLCLMLGVSTLVSAQEAALNGRLERASSADVLHLYVQGTVGEKTIDIADDGSFTVGVDLFERTRAILFWRGRSQVDWTCTFWLQPDSTLTVNLQPHKVRKAFSPKVTFEGANAALSTYTNLYYQSFERENLLDSAHIASLADFRACQQYVERTLQPIGEALMQLSPSDLEACVEEVPEPAFFSADEEDASESGEGSASDEEEDEEAEDDEELQPSDRLEMVRLELDYRQAEAEFTYAVIREHAGHAMEADAAFRQRLDEFNYADPSQADAIAFMTLWRVVAHPQQYAPLTDEAARLRCLAQYVTDSDVRVAVAERIMQQFFLRVQMGEADPTHPSCRALYDEFHRVSTSKAYDDFIQTQLDIMDHPELYSEDSESPEETEPEEETEDTE